MTFHEWLREKLISRNYTQDEYLVRIEPWLAQLQRAQRHKVKE